MNQVTQVHNLTSVPCFRGLIYISKMSPTCEILKFYFVDCDSLFLLICFCACIVPDVKSEMDPLPFGLSLLRSRYQGRHAMLLPTNGCSLELCIPFLKLTKKEQASISWKPAPLVANVTRNTIGAAANSYMHVVGSQ